MSQNNIGEFIQQSRKAKGFTQKDLGDRIGVSDKTISKWETFSDHNISKYTVLSKDNIDLYLHTPNKTLIYVVHLPEPTEPISSHDQYMEYYKKHLPSLSLTNHQYNEFGSAVILNDYETFIEKVFHAIKAI